MFNTVAKLHSAAEKGDAKRVGKLLERNADPDSHYGRTQKTILHRASKNGDYEIVDLLLSDSRAYVDPRNCFGETPLHYASIHGNFPIAEYLLSYDADVNAKDEQNRTPLHDASWNEHSDIVDLLLKHDADTEAEDKEGNTPLSLAHDVGGTVLEAFERHKEDVPASFYDKLIEDSKRNINFKIHELVPLIDDVHQVKFFYSLVMASHRSKLITDDDLKNYMLEGLKKAATCTTCSKSTAIFKLVLEKAFEDEVISKQQQYELDRDAEVTHTSNAPFVQEIWEHVRANTARIEGLEANVVAISQSLETLKQGLKRQKKLETTVGFMGMVLNAVSLGVAGTALSTVLNATLTNIVDFGDVQHSQAIVEATKDVSVLDAFEKGLELLQGSRDDVLDDFSKANNPVVALTYTAALCFPQTLDVDCSGSTLSNTDEEGDEYYSEGTSEGYSEGSFESEGTPPRDSAGMGHWRVGDKVHVIGFADGTVVPADAKYANLPNIVHVQYNDGTSYHVQSDQVQPMARLVDRITDLEASIGLEDVQASLSERIENLEVECIGSAKKGTFLDRLRHLEYNAA